MRWDVFCRMVDNWGDVGFGWRLAADLGARGLDVRLWLDDQAALAWMAPRGAPGVRVGRWREAAAVPPGDIVVETFGCGLPDAFLARMAATSPSPPWIDVQYLSAEAVVERNHGLPSPRHRGPGAGLTQWYFYPGFTPASGGLLREPGLLGQRAAFEPAEWWREMQSVLGAVPRTGERVASLFCYAGAPLGPLVEALAGQPTLLLVTAGVPADVLQAVLGAAGSRPALRVARLPFLDQAGYDRLLWAGDLNLVRGEDSLVRAIWAGAPFVWHLYPQADGAHVAKLDAFLERLLEDAPPALRLAVAALFRAWNGLHPLPAALPDFAAWGTQVTRWRQRLAGQRDLASQLLAFASARR